MAAMTSTQSVYLCGFSRYERAARDASGIVGPDSGEQPDLFEESMSTTVIVTVIGGEEDTE